MQKLPLHNILSDCLSNETRKTDLVYKRRVNLSCTPPKVKLTWIQFTLGAKLIWKVALGSWKSRGGIRITFIESTKTRL